MNSIEFLKASWPPANVVEIPGCCPRNAAPQGSLSAAHGPPKVQQVQPTGSARAVATQSALAPKEAAKNGLGKGACKACSTWDFKKDLKILDFFFGLFPHQNYFRKHPSCWQDQTRTVNPQHWNSQSAANSIENCITWVQTLAAEERHRPRRIHSSMGKSFPAKKLHKTGKRMR